MTSEVPKGPPARDPASCSAVRQPQQGRLPICLAPSSGHPKEPEGPCPAQLSLWAWLPASLASPRPGQSGPCDMQPPWSRCASLFDQTGSRASRMSSEPRGPQQQARGGWEGGETCSRISGCPRRWSPARRGRKAGSGNRGICLVLGLTSQRHSGLRRPFPLEKALELCLLSVPARSRRGCLLSACVLGRFSPASCSPADRSPPGSSAQASAASAPEGPSQPPADGAHQAQRLKLHPPLDSSRPALSREAASGWGPPSLGCRQKPPLGAVPPPPLGSQSCRLPRGWGVGPQPSLGTWERLPACCWGACGEGSKSSPTPSSRGVVSGRLELRICRWSITLVSGRSHSWTQRNCHLQAPQPSEAPAG